jgi:hypothetical protein
MRALWLAVLFFTLAVMVRLGHLGDNYALSYRASESTTVAISYTTIIFWLLLALAGLLAVVAVVEHSRIGHT